MAGRLEGKVAFITGAARGQGRAHAVRMAEEGADVIAVDICAQIDSNPYPLATPEDLEETERLVKEAGGQIVARHADVRERSQLRDAVEEGVRQLGHLDIVVANAGICPAPATLSPPSGGRRGSRRPCRRATRRAPRRGGRGPAPPASPGRWAAPGSRRRT